MPWVNLDPVRPPGAGVPPARASAWDRRERHDGDAAKWQFSSISLVVGGGAMTRVVPLVLLFVLTVAIPSDAQAGGGPVLGVRAAFASPWGRISGAEDDRFDNLFSRALPLEAEASWRVGAVSAGVFGRYAFARTATYFRQVLQETSGREIAAGLQLGLTLPGAGRLRPWLGARAGYAWAKASGETAHPITGARITGELALHGWEAALEGGAGWAVAGGLTLGPYASVTAGRFLRTERTFLGSTVASDVENPRWHGWFSVGLRGTFDL